MMWTTFDLILACLVTWIVTSLGSFTVIALFAGRKGRRKNIPTSDN